MNMKRRNVPKLRFPEFTGEWEQRKFSDLVLIERGGSPRPIDDYITNAPDGLNWVKIGDAPSQGRYITKTAEKIKPEGLSKTRQVHPGDLILSNSMSFGKPYIMGIDGCIHDGWLLIRDAQGHFDLKFLCHMLCSDQMLSQYRMFAAGSTVNNLNKELVGNTTVFLPSINEQKVVGDYLESVDTLITLQQRKLDAMKEYKKGMLQNMFPKEGESVPEVRFPGFTGEWEWRKLEDYLSLITYGFTNPMEDTDAGPWKITAKDIVNGRINYDTARHTSVESFCKLTDKSKPQLGDVLLTKDGTLGRIAIVDTDNICINQSVALLRCNELMTPDYLCLILNSPSCQSAMLNDAGGGTIKHIYITKVDKMMVSVPDNGEQQQLVTYFQNLDTLITLHQRKLEAMKEYKKGLLQQMFV